MKDAFRNVLAHLARPSVEGRRRRFVATVLVSATAAGSIPVIAALQSEAVSDIRGAPGSFWLSGETKAQVVLAATGGELASLALATEVDAPASFDVVDTGGQVLLHDRDAGTVTQIDGIEGKVGTTWRQPKVVPTSEEPVFVAAGASAWLVSAADRTVTRFVVDAERNDTTVEPTVAVGQFDQWVGTSDGVLWLLDRPKGQLTSVDGARLTTIDFAKPGLDLVLSALGDDPVVLDRTTGRLRWPRAAESLSIEGFSGRATLQEPTSGGSCIVVLLPETARCYDTRGEVRSMPVTVAVPDQAVAQVFANEENLVVASPSGPALAVASWPDRSWRSTERPDVSGRPLVAHFTPGALMVDDPGSRFAITADRGEPIELDKFNQRTVLLSADGVAAGAGVAAGDGGGEGGGDEPGADAIGDGQVFDDARGPDPRDDQAVTRVKRKKQIDVLANDYPRNSALAVKSVTVVSGTGTADVVDGSSVLFTPDGNLPGEAELTYTVTDASGRTGSAQVYIDIVGDDENTPPTLGPDTASVASGVTVSVDVLANDTDAEGDTISITKVVDPAHGTASLNDAGQISYRSDPSYVGPDTFIYEVKDGYEGGTAQTTVSIDVTAGTVDNRPPNPSPDRATVTAGRSIQVDVLANDTDPDGDGLRLVDVSVPSSVGLTVAALPSQQVAIAADPGAKTSLVQVTYSIADTAVPPNRVQSTIAVVVLAATEENRPPIAVNDSGVVTQNSPRVINLTGNDSDPDGDPLTITSLDLDGFDGTLGAVRPISPSSIEFTPGAGAVGATSFSYVVSDPNGASDTARVSIQVVPSSNSGPVAKDDIITVFGEGPFTIQVLANDFHPDGLALALLPPTYSAGEVSVNPDQTISFKPASADPRTYSFSYTVRDPNGRTASAQVVITVDKVTTKSAPVAANDQVTTVFGTSRLIDVLANDADPDGQEISLVGVSSPSAGVASIVTPQNRQIRYTPPTNYSGLANFTYTIRDADGNTATATVVVQVLPAAKVAPIARDDLVSMSTNQTREVDVLTNDADPDGANADLVLSPTLTAPAGVTATVVAGKIRVVSGTAVGSFVIPYSITDADGLGAAGKLTVIVTQPANQPPAAVADSASTDFRQPVSIAVLANDTDPEGGALTLASVTVPTDESTNAAAGSTQRFGNSVRYDPGTYGGGVVSFSYVVSDEGGRTAVGNVRVVVAPCSAAAPTPVADNPSVARGQTVNIPILGNDGATVIDSIALSEPTGGRARLTSNNTVDYTAPAAADTYSFNYTVTNSCGTRASAAVNVTVNRAPVAGSDAYTVDVGGPTVQLEVLRNDTDADNDTLTITRVTPESAANIVQGGRALSFKPSSTVGPVSFTYTIADCTSNGCGPATATAAVVVNVVQPNRPPLAGDDTATMTQGQASVLIDVLANDTDPDRDTLILTNGIQLTNPTTGASVTKEGNSVRFTPGNSCTTGTFVFVYWVTDGHELGDQGQVTVTINAQPNEAPVANNDPSFSTAFDTALPIRVSDLLANDSDPNSCDTLVPTFSPGTGGTISSSGGIVTFTPSPGHVGTATFTYTLSDGRGGTSSPATVSITVAPAPTTTTTPPTTTSTTITSPSTAAGSSSATTGANP